MIGKEEQTDIIGFIKGVSSVEMSRIGGIAFGLYNHADEKTSPPPTFAELVEKIAFIDGVSSSKNESDMDRPAYVLNNVTCLQTLSEAMRFFQLKKSYTCPTHFYFDFTWLPDECKDKKYLKAKNSNLKERFDRTDRFISKEIAIEYINIMYSSGMFPSYMTTGNINRMMASRTLVLYFPDTRPCQLFATVSHVRALSTHPELVNAIVYAYRKYRLHPIDTTILWEAYCSQGRNGWHYADTSSTTILTTDGSHRIVYTPDTDKIDRRSTMLRKFFDKDFDFDVITTSGGLSVKRYPRQPKYGVGGFDILSLPRYGCQEMMRDIHLTDKEKKISMWERY